MGSLAMMIAQSPEGTRCSAQCRVPWPRIKKKIPMTMLAANEAPKQQDGTGGKLADADREEWRDGFNGEADRKIR